MNKVGIVTLYRGYNYGTSLQAYALKRAISDLGYDSEILWTNENPHAGRDIRLGKIIRIARRLLIHAELRKSTIRGYRKSLGMPIGEDIKRKFIEFEKEELSVKGLSRHELRCYARDKHTAAMVCGSDQIWSAAGANVEPLYYLRFAPEKKRVAYAPSFGASSIPKYNQRLIKKYVKEIPSVSVREEQGAQIVSSLIGRDVPVVLDPTLLLDWNQWGTKKKGDYILLYFLNEPPAKVINKIAEILKEHQKRVVAIPYRFDVYNHLGEVEYLNADPREFVELIRNASCVYTDSFHGTIFSINLNIPFWTISRNYGAGVVDQSSRITSALKTFSLENQYVDGKSEDTSLEIPVLNFETVNRILERERKKSLLYLKNAIMEAEQG